MKNKSFLAIVLLGASVVVSAQNRLYVHASAVGGNNGTSWADAFTNLQTALQFVQTGSEVWVAEGSYLPTANNNRDSSFNLPSGVLLYGGFNGTETSLDQRNWQAHPAILSGDIGISSDSSDNSYTILYLDNPDSLTIVDGFVFRFGNAGYPFNDRLATSSSRSGGAIYIMADWEAFAMISNCRFERNIARNHGGAVYVNGAGSFAAAPTFKDCVFERNAAGQDGGGIARVGNSDLERPDFVGCIFRENKASRNGGGLYFQDANVDSWLDVQGCNFVKNQGLSGGGGAALRIGRPEGGMARVIDCRFEENDTQSWSGALSLLNQNGLPCQEVLIQGSTFVRSPGYEIQYDLLNTPSSYLRIIESRFEDHFFLRGIISGDRISNLIYEKDTIINVPNVFVSEADGINKTHYDRTVFKNIGGIGIFHAGEAEVALFTDVIFEKSTFLNGIINVQRNNNQPVFSSCNFIDCNIKYFLIGVNGASANFDNCLFNGNNITGPNTQSVVAYTNNCSYDDTLFCEKAICGPNNLFNLDPLFRDTANHDYSLLPCSPLINAGSNLAAAGILTDIVGNPRIQEGTVDIGAYESPAFALAAEPLVQPACLGASNGSISVSPVFGCEPYTYDWSPQAGNGPELNGLPPGPYIFTITDGSGRQILDTVVVASAPQPSLALASTDVQCGTTTGGSLSASVVSGTAPFQYTWLPSAADTALLLQQQPGDYSLTVVDANGCQDSASASIALLGMLTPMIGGQTISCFAAADGWLSLTPATGAAPFQWQWDGWPGTDSIAQPLGPGNYSVTVTDAYGCTASNTFPAMTEPGLLVVGMGSSAQTQTNPANGAAVVTTISGGTSPFYFEWEEGSTTQAIAGLNAGTYTVTVTDENGCAAVAEVVVEQMISSTEEADGLALMIYPNPAVDWVKIVFSEVPEECQVELSDASGRVIRSESMASAIMTLDLRDLPGGSYVVTILGSHGKAWYVGKVVKI
ncbi:MAG: T9SS type A sorting domain-containing protein [Saprospiraceae bacterium]|nr:T9SS type A sorting domain-containing protein [Saprospiraceae bacterium]